MEASQINNFRNNKKNEEKSKALQAKNNKKHKNKEMTHHFLPEIKLTLHCQGIGVFIETIGVVHGKRHTVLVPVHVSN